MSEQSSEAILLAKAAQDNTLPNTLSLGVDESYDLALRFWREAKYGAARAMIWEYTRPKSAQSVDVIVGMTNMLAVIDWSEGDYERAVRTLEGVAPVVSQLRDGVLVGKYCNSLAMCERAARRPGRAFGYYRDAIYYYERAGAMRYAHDVSNNLAELLIYLGYPEEAESLITSALQSCDSPLTLAQILDTRAKQELAFGHFDEARQLVTEAIGILCGLSGVDTYLAASARTLFEIDRAELASMERSFSGVRAI